MIDYYEHQKKLIDASPDKWLLAHGTGTGKTITAIGLALSKNVPALVICPKSIKQQWIDKFREFGLQWMVVTKEEFKKNVIEIPRFECVIVDEAHYFSNSSSQLTKALKWYFKKHAVPYRYLLTATPYLSTPWNIYSLADLLGHHWNYISFKRHFFYDIRIGHRMIPKLKPNMQADVSKLVNALGNTVSLQDCVDVPEQIFQQEYFDLTNEQREAIQSIRLGETNHIVKWTKIHQVCGGTLKGDGYTTDQRFSCEKVERVLELIAQHKKIAIVCRYNIEIEMLEKAISDAYPKLYQRIIAGHVPDRYSVVRRANMADRFVLLIQAACSEGYQLPTFPIMVFYSYDFSLKNYIQMLGRIQRIDAIKKNVYLSLITKDTIDQDVYACIQSKQDFHLELYRPTQSSASNS